jgi:mRNA (guanine-N7-)-methyltransferase
MEPFNEVWESERYDRDGGMLAERMGVVKDGHLTVSPQEMDAANFYIAFAFTKL